MSKVKVMHYMNQFFAGKGGEDKANVPAGSIEVTGPTVFELNVKYTAG